MDFLLKWKQIHKDNSHWRCQVTTFFFFFYQSIVSRSLKAISPRPAASFKMVTLRANRFGISKVERPDKNSNSYFIYLLFFFLDETKANNCIYICYCQFNRIYSFSLSRLFWFTFFQNPKILRLCTKDLIFLLFHRGLIWLCRDVVTFWKLSGPTSVGPFFLVKNRGF